MNISPSLGKWIFRATTTLAPAIIDLLYELQNQIDGGGAIEWRFLSSGVIGVVVVAMLHISRAGTEQAEANAEVATGRDQDQDDRVETPE